MSNRKSRVYTLYLNLMLTLVLGFTAERTAHYQLSNGYGRRRKRFIILCQRTNRIHDGDDTLALITLRKVSDIVLGCEFSLV